MPNSLNKKRNNRGQIRRNLDYGPLECRRLLAIDLSGVIAVDTLLDSPDGYRLTGTLSVVDGATLTVAPGVSIGERSLSGTYTISVNGHLEIDGATLEIPNTSIYIESVLSDRNPLEVRNTSAKIRRIEARDDVVFENSNLTFVEDIRAIRGALSIAESELTFDEMTTIAAAELTFEDTVARGAIVSAAPLSAKDTVFIGNQYSLNGDSIVVTGGSFELIENESLPGNFYARSSNYNQRASFDDVEFRGTGSYTFGFTEEYGNHGLISVSSSAFDFLGKLTFYSRNGDQFSNVLISSSELNIQQFGRVSLDNIELSNHRDNPDKLIIASNYSFESFLDEIVVTSEYKLVFSGRLFSELNLNGDQGIAKYGVRDFWVLRGVFRASNIEFEIIGGFGSVWGTTVILEDTQLVGIAETEFIPVDLKGRTSIRDSHLDQLEFKISGGAIEDSTVLNSEVRFENLANASGNEFLNSTIHFNSAAGQFVENVIRRSPSRHQISVSETALPNIKDNFFDIGFEALGSQPIDLTSNWWGTNAKSVIDEMMLDAGDDDSKPIINFEPFLIFDPLVGTAADDQFILTIGESEFSVTQNGSLPVYWDFDQIDELEINGLGGSDQVRVLLSTQNEEITYLIDQTSIRHPEIVLVANGFETTILDGQVGDQIDAKGSEVSNEFWYQNGFGRLTAGSSILQFTGVSNANISNASGSNSLATLIGTRGSETVNYSPLVTTFESGSTRLRLDSFDRVNIRAASGNDTIRISDSPTDDVLIQNLSGTYLTNESGTLLSATGFEHVNARFNEGLDRTFVDDTPFNDQYFASPEWAHLKSPETEFLAFGFDEVVARSVNGGNDEAFFVDSPTDDTLILTPDFSSIRGRAGISKAKGFGQVIGSSTEGNDVVHLTDSTGDDELTMFTGRSMLNGTDYELNAIGFEKAYAVSVGGYDVATFFDSAGDDRFVAKPFSGWMRSARFINFANGFDLNQGISRNGGEDIAVFRDSAGDEHLVSNPRSAVLIGDNFESRANGFQRTLALAYDGGRDTAFITDSENDDLLGGSGMEIWVSSTDEFRLLNGFDLVDANAAQGGSDRILVDEIDFELNVSGSWS